MVSAGLGLVFASPVGPVQRVADEVFCLAINVEEASDLGDGEMDLVTVGLGWCVRGVRLCCVGYC